MDRNDLGSFGVFEFMSLTHVEGTIYEAGLSFLQGSGSIEQIHTYGFEADATLGSGGSTYTHNQEQPIQTWTITHDLGKFPSVSVVNNNNVLMYGDIAYVNDNKITITFSAGFSGKAYLN
jgi:hypothetical protein